MEIENKTNDGFVLKKKKERDFSDLESYKIG